jgi:hypothetical protein
MLDPHTILAPTGAPMVVNAFWMQEKYDLFIRGLLRGGSSKTNTSAASRRPDVDENNDISKGKRLKRFVKTKIDNNVHIGLRNLTSEVEGEVALNYGNEE